VETRKKEGSHEEKDHEVRRFSTTKEYYHMASVPSKQVPDELLNIPTAKTSSISKGHYYAFLYIFSNWNHFMDYI
jgi:hypothetical protein